MVRVEGAIGSQVIKYYPSLIDVLLGGPILAHITLLSDNIVAIRRIRLSGVVLQEATSF